MHGGIARSHDAWHNGRERNRIMPAIAPAKLSPEERQRLLLQAAEKYMRGDMDVEEFEDQERQYRPDYQRIMRALVDSQTHLLLEVSLFAVAGLVAFLLAVLTELRRKAED